MGKVVAIVSSPRAKGNSAALVDSVIDGAMGLSTNIIVLHSLHNMLIHGCNACGACKTKGECVIEDEMSKVLNDIKDADGLVISTPVYFDGPCAQYKMLEDRLFSFMASDGSVTLPPGKKAVIVVTCGGSVEEADKVYAHISNTMAIFGIEVIGKIVYSDEYGKKPAADNDETLSKGKELGKLFRTNYREYDPHYSQLRASKS
ncbi:MAG: flavodoxin family protein [Candidatus Methanomethylophilaceae archaeon]|nr:flavodoxin family protein [Candidatus Methanomethylophilaceae archaeon]